MDKEHTPSPKSHKPASPRKSPYHVELSPSKELLQQYSEDPARAHILPLIEKKMQYSHKPRRSVLASYERLAEYRDLADSVPSSPETTGGKPAARKSKVPLNLILGQEAADSPNPLAFSLRTQSRANDSEASSCSPTNKLLPAAPFAAAKAEDTSSKQEYFPGVENSFKLVEAKKYNSPNPAESRKKSRPSKFAAAVSRAQTPGDTSSVKEITERHVRLPKAGNVSQSKILISGDAESQNQSQNYSQNMSMRRDLFVVKSPHRSYLDIMAAASESKRSQKKLVSKTGLSAGSPKSSAVITLNKSHSTANSRNSSLKKVGRGLDASWAKIHGLARQNPESAEPSIMKEATKQMLGNKYARVEDDTRTKLKPTGYLLPSISGYSIQNRSKPDIIVLPSQKTAKLAPKSNYTASSSNKLLEGMEFTGFTDGQSKDPKLEECFKLSLDFREVLILLVKFSQTHKHRIDHLVQRIFESNSGERGLRMVVLSALGPDDSKLRLQPEQKVEIQRIMEFLNINHGRWKHDHSSSGYVSSNLDEAGT